ncbi:MAG: hypothetical protein BWX92_03495 [Deltaproteobacteria bacterium ADurb.Bin135]|nr:MAG: hypothetical protein BWX92_03495 [Deltaproteobacteria bacterium ADurb.Bin135]
MKKEVKIYQKNDIMPKNLYEINLILIKCLIRGENTMHPPYGRNQRLCKNVKKMKRNSI